MIIIIELITLAFCLYLTGKKIREVIFINKQSILLGILFGLFYAIVMVAVKQTEIGSAAFENFVKGIGLPFLMLYTIYPFAVAISEEFIFRYFIARHWGILVANLLFTALHWRPNFPAHLFILVFLFGLSQSWLFKKTKTIWSPVIAHLFVIYFLLLG